MKNIPQRILVVLLVLFFSLGSWIQKPVTCSAITDAHMEIMPRKTGAAASYRFIFNIERKWEVHDDIILVWPPGTTINPPIPSNEHDKKIRLTQIIESITIGLSPCSACQGLPSITKQGDGSIRMIFKTHIGINPEFPGYNPVIITVPDTCGFTNPRREGAYTYKIATQSEPILTACEPFTIAESRLGEPVIVVDPPIYKQGASYKIAFQVGRGGWLKQGSGMIKLNFPEDTRISLPPSEIKPSYITINGIPIVKAPNGTKQNLNFPVPLEIKDSGEVVIQIDIRAGIINPSSPGDYTVEVSTSGDPDWVSSELYSIVKTLATLTINPPKVNRKAEYSLAFMMDDSPLNQGSKIDFLFPDTVLLPASFDPSFVLINKLPCLSVEIAGQMVMVTLGHSIKPMDAFEIRFLKEGGIQNPAQAGPIRISFQYNASEEPIQSTTVTIVEQKLEVTGVTVTPPNAGELATYGIKLTFGDGMIPVAGDLIIVLFSFSFSPTIIKVTEDLPQEYDLILNNIQNPEPGSYQLKVSTTIETEPVTSELFSIFPALPSTLVKISNGKLGFDDWYINPPQISFISPDQSAVIFYWWDDQKDNLNQYQGPFIAEKGQYMTRLHYFAKTSQGSETPKVIELKVDTVLPDFDMVNPKEEKSKTHDKQIHLVGKFKPGITKIWGIEMTTFDRKVYLNGQVVPVMESNGFFSLTKELLEGDNILVFQAVDIAGNSMEKEIVVTLESKR